MGLAPRATLSSGGLRIGKDAHDGKLPSGDPRSDDRRGRADPKEVGALKKISERMAHAMVKEGRLPGAVKVGDHRRWTVGIVPAGHLDHGTTPWAFSTCSRALRSA